jgi:putative hydrolases of HD superfamily
MPDNNIEKIFDFLHIAEKLKTTYRFGSVKGVRGDSSADHSWRLALMVFQFADELKLNIDIKHALKIALVHDLPEAITGDIDASTIYSGVNSKEEKQNAEARAIKKMTDILPGQLKEKIKKLWNEYAKAETQEAKFVAVLNKVEALIQVMEYKDKALGQPDFIIHHADSAKNVFPETQPLIMHVKKEIRKLFKDNNIEWK